MNKEKEFKNKTGWTALIIAKEKGNTEIVKELENYYKQNESKKIRNNK